MGVSIMNGNKFVIQFDPVTLLGLVGVKLAGLATIQGVQHRIESQIEAAETVTAAQAINVRFAL